MSTSARRDPAATQRSLEEWLGKQLGVIPVEVSGLKVPKAGYSNETILARASWRDPDGTSHDRPFVLRIQPSGHQLFVEPDALRQARVMHGLAGRVPVPTIWLTEDDPSVLGAPFFLMDLVTGRIPSDVPSWHQGGWTTELSPADRGRLYDNGLGALVAIHEVDWRDGLGFLDPPGGGTPLDRYLEHVQTWYAWAEPSRRYGTDVIDAALEYVVTNRPDDDGGVVSWGDARPGNLIFGGDLQVRAMVDWEGATIAPRGIDLGWWIVFDEFLCEAQGIERLEGVPGREGTIARYEELAGVRVPAVAYYEIVAGLVLSLINSRLADLFMTSGMLKEEVASEFVTRVTGEMARRLQDAQSDARVTWG